MDEHGPLCVGIDPHPALLAAWGLPDDATGLRSFALGVVEALVGRVAALKPQSAFFERHGAAGIAVLEEVLAAVRSAGGSTQVILDAKRGDIGSTMDGYADAYLRDGAPLACDALTVSPFLGVGSLAPAVRAAAATDRGLFVLALTSNPEAPPVQHARPVPSARAESLLVETADPAQMARSRREGSVAGVIAEQVGRWNAAELGDPTGLSGPDGLSTAVDGRMGSVGLVVGATVGDAVERLGIGLSDVQGPLLAPGVGAQGAGPADLARVFGDARRFVLASSSRAVLSAGPDHGALLTAAQRAARAAAGALR
jgi:orotidine-5'-phosphate decarboxylase